MQNEPASLKRWQKMDLYKQVRKARADAPSYVFHDGPPYANGSIHLGHLLNKVLKDFVVRTQTMLGKDCAYTPGWDCHGLPIEHKVMANLGDKARQMRPIDIRRKCRTYAEKFVKLQKGQMQRLLTLADYDDPYLTMQPRYEEAVLEVFASLVGKDIVFRQLKPVHWSIENQTALAEAELEYEDREDTSVYVQFDLTDDSPLKDQYDALMIWTTTPWTLPANLAVAVHEGYTYGVYQIGDRRVVIAEQLAASVLKSQGIEDATTLATLKGADLLGVTYQHPFIERTGKVVHALYVTLEDGTGMVHTAPGHGVEDYQTGLREGLDVYCPVQADGTFDHTVPDWLVGLSVWDANDKVVEHLKQSGHLFHANRFTHSYPHDWRGKTPIIFRATEQWFIGVDRSLDDGPTLREKALQWTEEKINFIPTWGRNRMRGMLDSRPDWCISRQRSWGLPIPAFYNEQGEPLLTEASVTAVAKYFGEHGSDSWFLASPEQLLESYDPQADADAPDWLGSDLASLQKASDTFDVWFESGSSWNAVMKLRGQVKPDDAAGLTDLYLEGSDQHRGWFQHSLLPALAVTGKTPFETVLTHGFMVDKDGRKMSKSIGNTLDVDDLLKEFGADVCRRWVSRLNVDNDIKVDHDFFRLAGEEYRKLRNTIRFLLSNLADFDPKTDKVKFQDDEVNTIDAWAIGELIALSETVHKAYEALDYRSASEAVFHFCNETLSAVYLVAVKDRLYCDKADSRRRRRSQATLYRIATTLIRLIAPITPHTADEAWAALEGEDADCVHVLPFQNVNCMRAIGVAPQWVSVMAERNSWLKAIEQFRQSSGVDNPLDMGLILPEGGDSSLFAAEDLADLCSISHVEWAAVEQPMVVDLRSEPRCERSWKRDGTVETFEHEGEMVSLSARDAVALGLKAQ